MATDFTLVLGGAASGKSRLAEQLAEHRGDQLTYLATATGDDAEMRNKIRLHQNRRGANWTTIEEPLKIANVLPKQNQSDALLIDCLTLWVANLLAQKKCPKKAAADLIASTQSYSGSLVMVSGETGLGIIPDNALSRRFSNQLGQVNQLMANHADLVVMSIAGLPLVLKGTLPQWL